MPQYISPTCTYQRYFLSDPPKLLLFYRIYQSLALFDGQYIDQIDYVAMVSPLGSVLATIFMYHFEENGQ